MLAQRLAGDGPDRDDARAPARARRPPAGGLQEEAHGRGGGEGDVVGLGSPPAASAARAARRASRTAPARRPRRPARAARRGARRAPRARARPARARRGSRRAPPRATRRRSARGPRPRRRRARPARARCPGRSRRPSRRRASARRRAGGRRRRGARTAPRRRWGWSRRSGHRARGRAARRRRAAAGCGWRAPAATFAPSASSRRARPLAWARARVTATRQPAQRPRRQPRDLLGERGDRPDDGDRRRAHVVLACELGDRLERAGHLALRRERPRFDDRRRLRARPPGGDQRRGDLRQLAHAHVQHERPREGGEARPVDRAVLLLASSRSAASPGAPGCGR